ncbi:hypothetical protein EG19_06380 [Thermoanaerobaculum aquaticum]|uniref:Uncharacterized protein n=1 Tax=Thermoanaerobaculum aquaticum TaxID=1312852 RepID=A0A062XRE9_9BACT|nr:hypothetical protein [Thermoanaerobaculum aquaticum]KDA53373.1 hypothetical protein EG19_06380 [Thermoanaerobaculum aquaticum]
MVEVGVFLPNLFLYSVVEAAIRSLGAKPVRVERGTSRLPAVLVLDVEAVPGEQVLAWARAGVQVLAFGPHQKSQEWNALRAAGAVVLPKSRFFRELPSLLEKALAAESP